MESTTGQSAYHLSFLLQGGAAARGDAVSSCTRSTVQSGPPTVAAPGAAFASLGEGESGFQEDPTPD